VSEPEGRCVICGGRLQSIARPFYTGRPLEGERIARCTTCGTGQVTPMPAPAELARLYTRDYYEDFGAGPGIAGGRDEVRPYLTQRLTHLTREHGRGRLLDLGCGIGLFVAHARDQGWDAVGVEPSAWAAAEGRRRFGIEIHNSALEEAPLAEGSFDVVHANHVLEHVADPVATLRTAARLLRPGGQVVMEVPQELHEPLAEAIIGTIRGEHSEPTGPYHVVFFSRKGLGLAAEKAGLRVDRIENLRHRDNLRPRALPFRLRRAFFFAIEAAVGRAPVYVLWAATGQPAD
jgi:SAM-dependent methyltransferase